MPTSSATRFRPSRRSHFVDPPPPLRALPRPACAPRSGVVSDERSSRKGCDRQECRVLLEGNGLAGGGRGVVLAHLGPVDDVVEGGDVLGPPVLVLKVVRVLPDVDAEDGDEASLGGAVHQRVVLVGRRDDLDRAVLGNREPRPSRPKHPGRRRRELRLEVIVRAKRLGHGVAERARGLAARLWAERAPEHAVVVVAAARVVELGGLGARHERD
mmetsp:Transcript_29813/g.94089  ORF Transcript_29813/g.94089 Transcript_29813/m.94089 type:complete len:214 (-) Transcript_29813:404-1045(-)